MLKSGLVSVTFRQLTTGQIIALVQEAGLDAIEWGGDVHVPAGDVQRALQVSSACRAAGIACCSYGSYCRLTNQERNSGSFSQVIETASALGASMIRVWAGNVDGTIIDEHNFAAIVDNALYFSSLASAQGLRTAYEFHGGTLTSTCLSAMQLLKAAPGLEIYWQPRQGAGHDECLADIANLAPYISNIHVFSWNKTPDGIVRLPLHAKSEQWQQYLQKLASLDGDRYALLEFVAADSPTQFLQDAASLKSMIDNR